MYTRLCMVVVVWVTAGARAQSGDSELAEEIGKPVAALGRHLLYWEVMPEQYGTRRLFGPDTMVVGRGDGPSWPPACALQDWRGLTRCSCGVVTARWAVTAAHCARLDLRQVMQQDGAVTFYSTIIYVFAHPEYHVQVVDEGRGEDVSELRHDVGLVQVAESMRSPPPIPDQLPDLRHLMTQGERVQVYGFGRTEVPGVANELRVATLQLLDCARSGWEYCACAASDSAPFANSGVCSGDSGGPVVWNGVQVGVTSMGPVECRSEPQSLQETQQQVAVSVLTSLAQYQDILYKTMGINVSASTTTEDYQSEITGEWWQAARVGESPQAQPPVGVGGYDSEFKMVRSAAYEQVRQRISSAAYRPAAAALYAALAAVLAAALAHILPSSAVV